MMLTVSKAIFYLFLLLPISFKLEIGKGVSFYPQELILPFLILFLFTKQVKSLTKNSYPFIIYLAALGVVFISTLISQLSILDLTGLLKTVKYILYILGIILVSNYSFEGFTKKFNKVAILCIGCTLLIYLYNLLNFNGSLSDFVHLSTWDINYVPSGFSNLNLNILSWEFTRSTGNHGVYGSYLVLVYIINLSILLEGKATKFNKLLIMLSLLNMFMMTSRETLLLFLIVNLLFFFKPLLNLKLKLSYIYVALFFIAGLTYLIVYDVNLSLIQKLNHTIKSFGETGGENNISLRFGVWHLILYSFYLFPIYLLLGYGYNTPVFTEFLTLTNNHFNLYSTFVTVPESLFFFFLAFGGIIALVLILLFFFSIAWETYKIRKISIIAELLLFFIFGLFVTNNTGGSILSDMLLAQFALVYFWVHNFYGQAKHIAHNCQS
ncbi:hypothetical protein [Pontibacter vulgaris]|uniref:hypothetical protein n=1 Tax=Pontibacter vulgaris TaxID=2905679 RepID=UPI001FA737F8|nr:hypothetical protein [Pontibacter vulgaris]